MKQNFFESKKGTVVIVESNSSARSVISEVVKSLGFGTVESMDSAKSALGYFEVESANWLLISLFANDQINCLHLMQIFTEFPKFQNLRVSLFLSEDEMCVAPKAYELGCLSHHSKDFTKDGLKAEFNSLLEKLKENAWNETLTAARYLADYFKKSGQKPPLLRLTESLYRRFPKINTTLVNLSEAQFLNDKIKDARNSLGQLKILGCEAWKALAAKYLPDDEILADIGIRNCVIIEPDAQTQLQLADILKLYGVDYVHAFSDGEAAEAFLQTSKSHEVIFMEWRIPKLTGPLLLQRIHAYKDSAKVPIVVVSSLVQNSDSALLAEVGVAQVISKPVDEKKFVSSIVQVMQQERYPTELRSIEKKITILLSEKNLEEAQELYDSIAQNDQIPTSSILYITALFAFYQDDFETAKQTCIQAIQKGFDQIKSIALLGKIFLQTKDYPNAVKCFDKAAGLAPRSIERLCDLANAQMVTGDIEAASSSLEKAAAIDEGNANVLSSSAKLEIQKGNRSKSIELLAKMGGLTDIVSDLNNTAVAFIHDSKFNDGLELYQKTIEALPRYSSPHLPRVLYNIALAFARYNALEESKLILMRLDDSNQSEKFKSKLHSLLQKVQDSIDSGNPIQLTLSENSRRKNSKSSDASTQSMDEEKKVSLATLERSLMTAKSGERCCHLIFYSTEPMDALYAGLRQNQPNFKLRSAISRAETFGVDRV